MTVTNAPTTVRFDDETERLIKDRMASYGLGKKAVLGLAIRLLPECKPPARESTKDIVERLRDACNGHPYAIVPWPHYLLHDAANEIERLRGEMPPASGEEE